MPALRTLLVIPVLKCTALKYTAPSCTAQNYTAKLALLAEEIDWQIFQC